VSDVGSFNDQGDSPLVSVLSVSVNAGALAEQQYPRLEPVQLAGTSLGEALDGLKRARGELVVHLEEGDSLVPDAVSTLARVLTAAADVAVAYPAFHLLDGEGAIAETVVPEEFELIEILRFQLWPAGPAPMFRRDAGLEAVRLEMRTGEGESRFGGLGFWLRIAATGRVRRLSEPLAARPESVVQEERGGLDAARERLAAFERAVAELALPPGSEQALASAARSACIVAASEIEPGLNQPGERFVVTDRFAPDASPETGFEDLDAEIARLEALAISVEQRVARGRAAIPILEDAVALRERHLTHSDTRPHALRVGRRLARRLLERWG
jgi:hypothetical protein